VVAPTCTQALEAGIAIAALASSVAPPLTADPIPAPVANEPSVLGARSSVLNAVDVRDEPTLAIATTDPWSAHLAVGVDMGTQSSPSATLAAALSTKLATGSIRALAVYGLPTVEEEVTLGLQRTRSDFAALGAVYCYGFGESNWLSTCGGFDARVVRVVRTHEPAGKALSEARDWNPTLGALAQVLIRPGSGSWRPELELTAEVPLPGAHSQTPIVGRGSIGMGLDLE
jgi:hypothetical protein